MREKTVSIDDILYEQSKERGFEPMALEMALFVKRVEQGGYSGLFLGKAFLSSYYRDEVFDEPLSGFMKLDAEGQRLFHEVMHIKLITGWSDAEYFDLAEKIQSILRKNG